ncbi:hypothetical protein N7540_003528 [Penicillium herquei]|nr:hypothetical protein N7540_003528 [Penicillium herquei]
MFSPPPRLLQRCKAACRLIHADISKKPRQTRERNANAQRNLAEILSKDANLFILRSLTSTLTQIGAKRDYGLTPTLMKWWTRVPHPQNLSILSEQICREFRLQYSDEKNIQNCWHARAAEASSGIPELAMPEEGDHDGYDLTRHHEYSGLKNSEQAIFLASHGQPGMGFSGSICEHPATAGQSHNKTNEQSLTQYRATPRRSQGSMLPAFLAAARQDLKLFMPWSGTPLPCLEIKLEVPIEFSEAFMKFRQSKLDVGRIEQRAAHKNDNSDLALAQ